jgi:Putative lumazine-binding
MRGSRDGLQRKESHVTNDRDAIEAAVLTYLDGLFEGDTHKLASVFHPTSALTWEKDGVLTPLPRDKWLEALRTRASAKARGLERHDEILQIDQASGTTAFVKLKCQIPPQFFTDYLCFLKVDGRWQVAQKVFSIETRE